MGGSLSVADDEPNDTMEAGQRAEMLRNSTSFSRLRGQKIDVEGCSLTQVDIENVFDAFDVNKDGSLDLSELEQMLDKLYGTCVKKLQRALNSVPTGEPKRAEVEQQVMWAVEGLAECRQAAHLEAIAKEMLTSFDIDNSGTVSRAEFVPKFHNYMKTKLLFFL